PFRTRSKGQAVEFDERNKCETICDGRFDTHMQSATSRADKNCPPSDSFVPGRRCGARAFGAWLLVRNRPNWPQRKRPGPIYNRLRHVFRTRLAACQRSCKKHCLREPGGQKPMLTSFWSIAGYIIPFRFVLSLVVFFHELGHFLIGRWCGVKVEAFSLGFGPEIYGFDDRRGTRWRLAALPLGGYVKFFGEANGTSVSDEASL